MKNPVALLLLYLWYTRASESRWWIRIRAEYELPAIRTYLERYHGDNSVIQALLPSIQYATNSYRAISCSARVIIET